MDRFNKASEILIEKLAGEVGKDAIDIESFVTLCSLDIICGKYARLIIFFFSCFIF